MAGPVITAMQRAGPIAGLGDVLREFGVPADTVTAGTGVDLEGLTAESRIPFSAVLTLLERAASRSRCHHLGLLLGARYAVASHGEVVQLASRAGTLRQALLAFVAMQPGYSSGAAVYLRRLGPDFLFGYGIYDRTSPGSAQLYDCVLAFGCALLRELTRGEVAPLEILFCHRQPDDTEPYRRVLRTPLRFNETEAGIVISGRSIDCLLKPKTGSQEEVSPRRSLDARQMSESAQVRHLIRPLLLAGDPSMEDAARLLGRVPRTLRRHLAVEGTTFYAIRDEVRHVVACELLALTDLHMSDISASLRFSNQSAFDRAFRRWSGMTPSCWRRTLAQMSAFGSGG
jgi:AraC-like DNA-binding protein